MAVKRKSVPKGTEAPFPKGVPPMLATLVKEPTFDNDYIYEVKWDGYRIIAYKQNNSIVLRSRKLLDYTKYYPPVIAALKQLKYDAILDGEVVVLDKQGKPDFDALQAYTKKQEGLLAYYVFDLLWLDGYDLTGLTVVERKKMLQKILPVDNVLRYSDAFDDGTGLFEQAKQIGLEGIVAKKKDSIYIPSKGNKRTKYWLKVPIKIIREFVIGGWTESGSGRAFRSLLFGAYKDGKLICVGHAGGGYKEDDMPVLLMELKKIEVKKKPFANEVVTDTKPHWTKPLKVARFEFATWTKSGNIRKPAIYKGRRDDKAPKDVLLEESVDAAEAKLVIHDSETDNGKQTKAVNAKPVASRDSNWPELERIEITSKDTIEIEGCSIELTNVERELWSDKDIRKADLIQYYHSISKYILPHLKDRPLSLHVKPYSPTAPGLYIKDMEGRQPECADIFSTPRKHPKPGKRAVIDYLVCNNLATLIYMINVGCIDINPWTARTTSPKKPDYIVIDLDPSDEDFKKAIEAAKAAKEFFDEHKLKAFVKTSGKTGIHLVIPCGRFTFPQARSIALHICNEVHLLIPDITTTEVRMERSE